ncbi:copper chaperone [Geodermatophilus africanus]|uniref:Copper chaperone n=1 Tax=Geodermatophilus africanus TaxID=1137993 RepID=A0A1H3AEZ3_9ACTN|nr:heavy metal-associated domain-containing protein [Geodermatophilus africanus]SDX27409.1 copper chaperone [Geodermatophilus africanus]
MAQFSIQVPDMTCRHCVRSVSQAVSDVTGVREVVVDLATKAVHVRGAVEPDVVCAAITAVGYAAHVIDSQTTPPQT